MSSTRAVTLQQACMSLGGISYRTLRKWMGRLQIERARHARDWRFYTISVEAVAMIRRARAEMPPERIGWMPRAPMRVVSLPVRTGIEGLSYARWAKDHNLDIRTVAAAVKGRHKLGKWIAPTVALVGGKLDELGQRALWERYHMLTRFTLCKQCPHGSSASLRPGEIVDDKTPGPG